MKAIPFAIAFLTSALGLIATSQSTAAEPRVVVVFGDSITEGNALPVKDRPKVWVRLVEEMSAGKLRLVNEGKGGRPTDSEKEFDAMLKRQAHADESFSPWAQTIHATSPSSVSPKR